MLFELAATGAQGQAMQKLVELCASSSTWQARLNVESPEAAERKIQWPEYNVESERPNDYRPFLLIEENDHDLQTTSGGGVNNLYPAGSLWLTIEDVDQYPESFKRSYTTFRNLVDGILADVCASAGTDDRLNIVTITQQQRPAQPPTSDTERYWLARYIVEWSGRGLGG